MGSYTGRHDASKTGMLSFQISDIIIIYYHLNQVNSDSGQVVNK